MNQTKDTTNANRFEVRSTRTHSIEAAYADVLQAIAYAGELHEAFGERFYVADTFLLPESPVDTRRVWPRETVTP